jgi:DNA-binding transcriptional MerR regulator
VAGSLKNHRPPTGRQDTHLFHVPLILAKAAQDLSYFYGMQQLDLFGFPIETPAPKKKEKAAKASDVVPAQTEIKEVAAAPVAAVETAVVAQEEIVAGATISIEEEKVQLSREETIPEIVAIEEKTISVPKEEKITVAPPVAAETIVAERPVIKKIVVPVNKQAGKRGRKSFKEMDNEADLIEVPGDEILQQKLYYSISEVASWFKVNTSLLRYWENEFDVLQPRKTRKGDRLFRVEDIKNLQLIYFLLRQRKFSIDGAKNYLKNNKQEADTQIRLVESLTRFRSFLLEMKANLQA